MRQKHQKGNLNEGRISLEFDITEDGKIVELTETGSSIENQVIRGDLELVKVSDGDLFPSRRRTVYHYFQNNRREPYHRD